MTPRIADTFTAALDRLTAQEKAAAKQAAFDLQVDPSALHEFPRAARAIADAGQDHAALVDPASAWPGRISLSTMHAAKGREFRAVAVMACDALILPSHRRLAEAADETPLEEIFLTERHLLYVTCTRPRDRLLVTGASPISGFLLDLVDPASRSEP